MYFDKSYNYFYELLERKNTAFKQTQTTQAVSNSALLW